MADILSGISGGNQSQLDLLVEAFKSSQQSRVQQLDTRKSTLETKRTFFNGLNSRLNSLVSTVDKFTASNANTNFESRKVSSTDSTYLTATATADANLGIIATKVERLATKDVLISERKNLTDSFGIAAGDYTFDITIGSSIKSVSVNLEGTETFETGMKKIAEAINNTEDIGIKASFVKDSLTTGRLSFTSSETGTTNRIQFSDSSILSQIGLDTANLNSNSSNRTLSSNTGAGYKTADYSLLDSQITVDNITITRPSNTIDDAIEGITFNLIKAQNAEDVELNLTTEVNTDSVKSFIEPLLKNINDILSFIQSNPTIRRSDSAVNSFLTGIRDSSTRNLNPYATSDEPKYLSDIGIKSGTNGLLSITNLTALEDQLKIDPTKVAELFTGTDGFISKISKAIEPFKGDSGLITSRTSSLNSQIDLTTQRTNEVKDRIDIQAEGLRKQYLGYMKALNQAQSQMSLLSTFQTDTSGYNSLLQ